MFVKARYTANIGFYKICGSLGSFKMFETFEDYCSLPQFTLSSPPSEQNLVLFGFCVHLFQAPNSAERTKIPEVGKI